MGLWVRATVRCRLASLTSCVYRDPMGLDLAKGGGSANRTTADTSGPWRLRSLPPVMHRRRPVLAIVFVPPRGDQRLRVACRRIQPMSELSSFTEEK